MKKSYSKAYILCRVYILNVLPSIYILCSLINHKIVSYALVRYIYLYSRRRQYCSYCVVIVEHMIRVVTLSNFKRSFLNCFQKSSERNEIFTDVYVHSNQPHSPEVSVFRDCLLLFPWHLPRAWWTSRCRFNLKAHFIFVFIFLFAQGITRAFKTR